MLRIANPHADDVDVTITAVDAAAQSGESAVALSVPARGAVNLTSVELEEGGDHSTGYLGDGYGKWRLTIEATKDLYVLSLLHSTGTGHITNLSR